MSKANLEPYRILVKVSTNFVGTHSWPDAKGKYSNLLRRPHRHLFEVIAWKEVTHTNRQIEFLELKEEIDKYIQHAYNYKEFEYSCEQIALDLVETFSLDSCEILEDGENGAVVLRN